VWGLFLSLEPPSYGSRGVDHPLPPYSPGGVSYPKIKTGGFSDSGKHLGGEEGKFAVREGGGAWPGEKLNKIQYSFAEK
jgi:hypothetical protein